MSTMLSIVLRRLTGIAIALVALVYWGTKFYGYDLPGYDMPQWVHSPAFWGGMTLVGIWAWLPILSPVGNREVSLAQEMPRDFVNPQQVENKPFEMNGMWCIIWNGQYMVWDSQNNQWVPYRGN